MKTMRTITALDPYGADRGPGVLGLYGATETFGPLRILVTGGAGFVGHHMCEHILKTTDYEVVSLDRLDASGDLNRLSSLPIWRRERRRVTVVHHDLRAAINLSVAARIGRIDAILHLAAASHVDRSIADPMEFVLDNVVGTTNILNFARERGVPFVYFSTDEVFGPAPDGINYREWDRYRSANPYSASKAGGEEMALAFANTYGVPLIITHAMNIIGERQHPEKYFPMTIAKVLSGEEVTIHADPSLTRAGSRFYIHARNVADAVMFLLRNGVSGEKYNIAGECEVDNYTLARLIAEAVGKPLKYRFVDAHSSRPGHDLRYALDDSKLRGMGWRQRVSLEDSIASTVAWTLKNREWLHLPREIAVANATVAAGDNVYPIPERKARPVATKKARKA